MDMNFQEEHAPQYHIESVFLSHNTPAIVEKVKDESFIFMSQLEGWCTRSKASILIDLVFMLNPKTIVEVGVWGGKSLIPMAHALKVSGKGGTIFGIDPWDNQESVKGMDGVNYDWWSKVDHGMILRGLERKIQEFRLDNQIVLIKNTSQQAPPIPYIDILHLDGNHSDEASNLDVRKWGSLVRHGGVIVFDDLTWGTNANAIAWLDNNCVKFAEFREDNAWGIWIKP